MLLSVTIFDVIKTTALLYNVIGIELNIKFHIDLRKGGVIQRSNWNHLHT